MTVNVVYIRSYTLGYILNSFLHFREKEINLFRFLALWASLFCHLLHPNIILVVAFVTAVILLFITKPDHGVP